MTFFSAIKSNNGNHILCAWNKVGEGDGIPRWGHSIFSGSSTAMLRMMANLIASDGSSRSNPVDSERVGSDIRKVNATWGIKTYFSHPGEEKESEEDIKESNKYPLQCSDVS
jgi:hypothetical protein